MLGLDHLEQLETVRQKQDTEILAWEIQDRRSRLWEMERIKGILKSENLSSEVEHKTTHCLDRAAKLVCGERAKDYGPPSDSFARVATAWQAYWDAATGDSFTARDVANLMIIYKTIRDAYKPKQDNMDDIAGYAQVAAWIGTDA